MFAPDVSPRAKATATATSSCFAIVFVVVRTVSFVIVFFFLFFDYAASHLQLCFNATKHKLKQNYKNVQLAQVVSHYSFSARPGRYSVSASASASVSVSATTTPQQQQPQQRSSQNKKVTVRAWSENRSVQFQLENQTRVSVKIREEASQAKEERRKRQMQKIYNTFALPVSATLRVLVRFLFLSPPSLAARRSVVTLMSCRVEGKKWPKAKSEERSEHETAVLLFVRLFAPSPARSFVRSCVCLACTLDLSRKRSSINLER